MPIAAHDELRDMRVAASCDQKGWVLETPTQTISSGIASLNNALLTVDWKAIWKSNAHALNLGKVDIWRTMMVDNVYRLLQVDVVNVPDFQLDLRYARWPTSETTCGVRCGRKNHKIHVSATGRMTLLSHPDLEAMKAEDALVGERCRCHQVSVLWFLSVDGSLGPNVLPEPLRMLRNRLHRLPIIL